MIQIVIAISCDLCSENLPVNGSGYLLNPLQKLTTKGNINPSAIMTLEKAKAKGWLETKTISGKLRHICPSCVDKGF